MQRALTSEQKKILVLSSFGGMLEFYDFTIYGIFSVYFAHQFFPGHNHFLTVMAAYTVFFLGYIARPLGGIIFSHIGDEIGRKAVLILTMVLMGVASMGLGCLPTYAEIGIWAPIFMVSLRLLQGLALGGELPSTIVYATESIPTQRIYAMGCVFAATIAGLLPGMLMNVAMTRQLSAEQMHQFGWRIPFILGGLLCFIAYQIRKKLHETQAFQKLDRRRQFPLLTVLREHLGSVFVGVGLIAILATSILLAIIFMPTYLTEFGHVAIKNVSEITFVATIFSVMAVYGVSSIAYRFLPITLMYACILSIILGGALCYFMFSQGYNVRVALIIFAIVQGSYVSLAPAMLSKLFPISVRLTGVALSYNIAFVIFGGLTPMIVTAGMQYTHWFYLTPFLWLFVVASGALLAVSRLKKCTMY